MVTVISRCLSKVSKRWNRIQSHEQKARHSETCCDAELQQPPLTKRKNPRTDCDAMSSRFQADGKDRVEGAGVPGKVVRKSTAHRLDPVSSVEGQGMHHCEPRQRLGALYLGVTGLKQIIEIMWADHSSTIWGRGSQLEVERCIGSYLSSHSKSGRQPTWGVYSQGRGAKAWWGEGSAEQTLARGAWVRPILSLWDVGQEGNLCKSSSPVKGSW